MLAGRGGPDLPYHAQPWPSHGPAMAAGGGAGTHDTATCLANGKRLIKCSRRSDRPSSATQSEQRLPTLPHLPGIPWMLCLRCWELITA
jgi:hypothetical protein